VTVVPALRFQHPQAIFHAHTTGAGSIPIVREISDCELWVRALGIVVHRFGLRLFAWVLMTTHWHLLVGAPHTNLDKAMHWLNSVYAHGFNQRYARRGHLFGKRYDAWLIQTEAHLLNTATYIAWNPVRAGMVGRPSAYSWSSYGSTASGGRSWPANASDELLVRAGGLEAYRRFVESGERVLPEHLAA
jgi:putative transposase